MNVLTQLAKQHTYWERLCARAINMEATGLSHPDITAAEALANVEALTRVRMLLEKMEKESPAPRAA